MLVSRGLAAIVFGAVLSGRPAVTFAFFTYCVVDGAMAFAGGYRGSFWHALARVVVNIDAGAIALGLPGITFLAIALLIATWSIVRGTLDLAVAIGWPEAVDGAIPFALAGMVSIASGLLIASDPHLGAASLAQILSAYALVFGVLIAAAGLRLRRVSHAWRCAD
jgi:uncharacterized membrane protein HdeD (DUF308 family)